MHFGGLLLADLIAAVYIGATAYYAHENWHESSDNCEDSLKFTRAGSIFTAMVFLGFLGFQLVGVGLSTVLECLTCCCRRVRDRDMSMHLMENGQGFDCKETLSCVKPFVGIMSFFGTTSFLYSTGVYFFIETSCKHELWGTMTLLSAIGLLVAGSIVYISKRY